MLKRKNHEQAGKILCFLSVSYEEKSIKSDKD